MKAKLKTYWRIGAEKKKIAQRYRKGWVARHLQWDPSHERVIVLWERPDSDALVTAVTEGLLLTDAMTGNHDGTPEHYIVEAENVEYLVRTVLQFAESCRAQGLS